MNGSQIRLMLGVFIAVIMIGYAFMSNSSPYVTIEEAKKLKGNNLHLAGDLVDGSFEHIPSKKVMTFFLKDMESNIIRVIYTGEQPANISKVSKVVAVGVMRKDHFLAHKLLIKCPSKYESEKKEPSTASSGTNGVKNG